MQSTSPRVLASVLFSHGVGRSNGVPESVCALYFLAAGFQAFEVQLVLRQALPNIWTVLKDEGVSPYLGVPSWWLPHPSPPVQSNLASARLLSRVPPFSVFQLHPYTLALLFAAGDCEESQSATSLVP